ncbi:hypothetical protein [Campylobacter coli]|uniref:hypothetical protein n=1 Tax=Campylobacter coli TaxID=195 RepID=UPI0009A92CB5|nr:hypothetical protein [Campylobacter coli]
MENGNLKVDEQYKVTLPPNLITVLEYDKKDFEGATLKNFIDDVECELSDWEICRRKNKMSQKKNKMSYFCDKLSFFQP